MTITSQKSLSDFTIETLIKAVRDNAINTSASFKEGKILPTFNTDLGTYVSNLSKLASSLVVELIAKQAIKYNMIDEFKKIKIEVIEVISLSIKKNWIKDSIDELKKSLNNSDSDIKREIYQKTINNLENSLKKNQNFSE